MTTRNFIPALIAFLCSVAGGMTVGLPPALATVTSCPNEEFRVGRSASLPNCRAYELVSPEELGRTEDMTFNGEDHLVPSSDGEQVALESLAPVGPSPSDIGARAVFYRTPTGWTMKSIVPPGDGGTKYGIRLLSPELGYVAFETNNALNFEYKANTIYEAGPVGGPYTRVASLKEGENATWMGANGGTSTVRPFSDVLFITTNHQIIQAGSERAAAEETDPGLDNLYDLTEGQVKLVALNKEGKILNPCGAVLGAGTGNGGYPTQNAVSADGSKIFFESPQSESGEEACKEPARVYMREAGNSEPVEVSAPEGVKLRASERALARYDGATPDGSKVFFTTGMRLVPTAPPGDDTYEYDTEAPTGERLKFAYSGERPGNGATDRFLLSENGESVYYGEQYNVNHYDAKTGISTPVARWSALHIEQEPSYTTPNGEFLLFGASGTVDVYGPDGWEVEPRNLGQNELYRYDAATGSVTCISCGEEAAAAKGIFLNSNETSAVLEPMDGVPSVVQSSEDGKEVFFETTARLVPQDQNSDEEYIFSQRNTSEGADVYEWEEDGHEGCENAFGCDHLISAGEDVGPSYFLGASKSGRDIFFATSAQLVSWATPEYSNIYDARVDGGFAPPRTELECLTCQGVGITPPSFGPGSSLTFVGAGNPPQNGEPATKQPSGTKCVKGKKLRHGRCVKAKGKKAAKGRKAKRAGRRAKRSRSTAHKGGK